ncbi:hypothetical protein [Lactovum miscens]|uniref:Uncharacterized protein n=1 Tax=Lactovum miscens TaxID=190387 RepID=A0A841C2J9_9LACT|nr:hypothetical protein [Lactovum miscens]MBB5888186.1 hypothetical protein [Lactovum miscens]
MVKLLSAGQNQNFNAYTDYDSLPEIEVPAYDWHHLFKSYRKPTSELKKVMKWITIPLVKRILGLRSSEGASTFNPKFSFEDLLLII